MIKGELDNERRASGFLGEVSQPHEFNGKYYTSFLIRYIRQGGWYRVYDYMFKADQNIINQLQLITPNSLVMVTFEINTKENKGGFKNISLKATDIIEYGDSAPGWVWKIHDWTKRDDVIDIKKKFPDIPDLEEILKETNQERLERKRSAVNNGYSVKDKVVSNKPFDNTKTSNYDDAGKDVPF